MNVFDSCKQQEKIGLQIFGQLISDLLQASNEKERKGKREMERKRKKRGKGSTRTMRNETREKD